MFLTHFGHRPSSTWTCRGFLENHVSFYSNEYNSWVELYGEEEAEYLKSILCPKCQTYVAMENEKVDYPEVIQGDIQYLYDILRLNHKDLVVLHKNERIKLTNNQTIIEVYGIR